MVYYKHAENHLSHYSSFHTLFSEHVPLVFSHRNKAECAVNWYCCGFIVGLAHKKISEYAVINTIYLQKSLKSGEKIMYT